MDGRSSVLESIEARKSLLAETNDRVWDFAETRFEESRSSALLRSILEAEGFEIADGPPGLGTAFVARYGSGKPVIGVLGEYDALHGLSQEAGLARRKPLVEGGSGHGCGHQALGAASLAAVLAVKDWLESRPGRGTIVYYGCPGEEGGSGKVYMVRSGCFDGVDIAFSYHPGAENYVTTYRLVASVAAYFKFHGTSSHAGFSPHLGRSALDAVELMNVGANFLREHVVQEARIHYAITDSGGLSPNVVQSEAAVLYQIRAPRLAEAMEIYRRVAKIAQGAALMTETQLTTVFDRASSEPFHCGRLESFLHEKLAEAGPTPVDEADLVFAREIRGSFEGGERGDTERSVLATYGLRGEELARAMSGKDIIDFVYPYMPTESVQSASSDLGDVSWVLPTAQFMTVCFAKDTPPHSWQEVAQGKAELCHKGVLKGGEVMALAAIELMERPQLVTDIEEDFRKGLGGRTYSCPIPADVMPAPRR
jgi:amidohydrolase